MITPSDGEENTTAWCRNNYLTTESVRDTEADVRSSASAAARFIWGDGDEFANPTDPVLPGCDGACSGFPTACPVSTSHTRTDLAHEPDTTVPPSPALATPNTLSVCPSIVLTSCPVASCT